VGGKKDSNPFTTDVFDPLANSDKLDGMYVVPSCSFKSLLFQLYQMEYTKINCMHAASS
jgi:hypothetical protein